MSRIYSFLGFDVIEIYSVVSVCGVRGYGWVGLCKPVLYNS